MSGSQPASPAVAGTDRAPRDPPRAVRLQPDPDRVDFIAPPGPLPQAPPVTQERSGDSVTVHDAPPRARDPDAATHRDTDSSASVSSDEFDWDAENDAVAPASEAQRKAATRGRTLWLAFMKVPKSIRVLFFGGIGAGILVTPEIVFETHYKTHPALPTVRMWSLWFAITWATSTVTYSVVDVIPKIIIHFTSVVGGRVAKTRTILELTLAVSGWLKLALDIAWSWIAFSLLRDELHPPGNYWAILDHVMQALFAAGLLLLAEKIFLNFVAIRFHHKALADRITDNNFALQVLDHLSTALSARKKNGKRRSDKRSREPSLDLLALPGQDVPTSVTLEKPNPLDRPTAPEAYKRKRRNKRMTSLLVDHLGDAFETVGLRSARHRQGNFQSLHSAKRLAKELFSTLSRVKPPRKYLLVSDFYPYFPTPKEAEAAFAVFDNDGNGDVSKVEMREAVQRTYRERKALTAGLKDVDSAVGKLDAVLIAMVLLVMIFICLLIFKRSDTITSLVPLATIVLGFSFIFGHSAQLLFESMIFIFSTHVYDVGDLVMIDDQPLVVKEFGLFSTVFRRVDGQEIIAPNTLLSTSKLVHNLRRSKSMWEDITLQIAWNTPLDIVEQLRNHVNKYVSDNSRAWSNCAINIDKMEFQNSICLVISMEHRANWQDWGGRWGRRTLFMRFLKTTLEELDVRYSMPRQPIILPKNTPEVLSAMHDPTHGGSRSSLPSALGSRSGMLGNAGTSPSSGRNRAPVLSLRAGGDRF